MVFLVEGFFLWSEGKVDSFRFTEGEIFFERLWVIFKIRCLVKLDGVDENGNSNGSL